MSLARQAHTIEYRRDKAKRADKWMTQSAEAIGIDLDDKDLYPCLLCVVCSCCVCLHIYSQGNWAESV